MSVAGSLGRYVSGDGFWHRSDPRAKLALVLFAAAAFARPDGIAVFCCLGAALLAAGAAGGLRPRHLVSPLASLGWLLAATLAANILLVPGVPLPPPLPGSREGLLKGIEAVGRLSGMLIAVQVMVVSTPALQIARGVEALASPLPVVRRAASGFAMVFGLTVRFVPLLLEEWGKLRESARVRGHIGGAVGTLSGLIREAHLLVPLFVVSFRKSEEMALSIHLRGYRPGAPRTSLRPLRFTGRDAFIVAASAAGCAGSWML